MATKVVTASKKLADRVLLSLATVPAYLVGRGHLRAEQWIDDGYALTSVFGRNRNFAIRTAAGSGMFLKQIRLASPELIAVQNNELRMLAAMETCAGWTELRSMIPRLIDHDRSRHVLITEHLAGRSFHDQYASVVDSEQAERMTRRSAAVGELLARFHQAGRRAPFEPGHPELDSTLPEGITLQPPHPLIAWQIGPVCQHIIAQIRADSLWFQQLQANRTYWRAETAIHGDLKWENLMVTDKADTNLKLVDWEFASLGDPAWDVAGVLQSFLVHDVNQSLQTARPLVVNVAGDVEAFWVSYRQHVGDCCDDQFVHRVQRFCAARLIQTALEREYQSTKLSTVSERLMAIGRGMLCQAEIPAAAQSILSPRQQW